MWLSERVARQSDDNNAAIGPVTIAGTRIGVLSDAEKRGVFVFAPGGYCWRPSEGEDVLIIKCESEEICTIGRETEAGPEEMVEGEVYIKSREGASVWLKNDGTMELSGEVHMETPSGTKIHLKDDGEIEIKGIVNITGGLIVNGIVLA